MVNDKNNYQQEENELVKVVFYLRSGQKLVISSNTKSLSAKDILSYFIKPASCSIISCGTDLVFLRPADIEATHIIYPNEEVMNSNDFIKELRDTLLANHDENNS